MYNENQNQTCITFRMTRNGVDVTFGARASPPCLGFTAQSPAPIRLYLVLKRYGVALLEILKFIKVPML